MARHFTHYWTRDTCDYCLTMGDEGLPIDYTSGSRFVERGLKVGDFVYVVTVREGELFLVAKMQVGEILFSDKEVEARIGYKPWPAPEYLMPQSCTPIRLNRRVPLDVTKRLKSKSAKGIKGLKFTSQTKLDRQTLRTVRELTHSSAAELDKLLEGMSEVALP
jgi:hypothetical protein